MVENGKHGSNLHIGQMYIILYSYVVLAREAFQLFKCSFAMSNPIIHNIG